LDFGDKPYTEFVWTRLVMEREEVHQRVNVTGYCVDSLVKRGGQMFDEFGESSSR
jgi:hypothetical protein